MILPPRATLNLHAHLTCMGLTLKPRRCQATCTPLLFPPEIPLEARLAELTSEACRAGRALLKWKLSDLAQHTGLSIETLTQFENGRAMRKSNRDKIAKALDAAGVTITNGERPGAYLRKGGS